MEGTGINDAAKLLSTPPSELSKPPADEKLEGQDAPVKQEATPETKEAKPETPPEKGSDTKEEPKLFKVKVDGEELEVSEDELKKGYSRESHYQKKAKDLAQDREALTSKSTELDQRLSDAALLVEDERAKLDSADMKALRDEDPDAYLRETEKIQAKIEKFEKLKTDRQKELDANETQRIAKEQEALFEAYPHWKGDDETMAKEVQAIYEQAVKEGYSDDDWNAITDHRQYLVLDKARKFDEIESASLEQKEVKTKTKSVDPSAKSEPVDRDSQSRKEARDKLLKTGKLRDAAAFLTT